jgi:hypothetical protein
MDHIAHTDIAAVVFDKMSIYCNLPVLLRPASFNYLVEIPFGSLFIGIYKAVSGLW